MSEYEYAVKWESIGAGWPEEVHPKESYAKAEAALAKSAFPGVIVRRSVTEWDEL